MSGNDNAGKISRTSFIAASIALFVLAIVGSIARVAIRLRYQKRLYLDDAFLFIAVLCLCAAMALLFLLTPSIYLVEALITNHASLDIPSDFLQQSFQFQKLSDAYLVLTYNTVFAVKFSFIFFFRILTSRVRQLRIYWWVVAATTGVVWAYGLVGVFITCPYFDDILQCAQASEFPKALGISAVMIVLDILTDIMIIIIPVRMLWNMKVKLSQKVAIGTTLCLSVAMVITCIVQISSIRTSTDAIDISWEIFWQLVEACIAVLMVSLTALRSFFVGHVSRVRPASPWSSGQAKRWLKRRVVKNSRSSSGSDGVNRGLPEIPRATLTGMRTLIRGSMSESMLWSRTSVASTDRRPRTHSDDPWRVPPLELPPLWISHPRSQV